jgi:RimJ/RimL family protein N-acetyltransferase
MIDFKLPIIGTKVLIRELNEKDLESLYPLEIDPDVKRYLKGPVNSLKEDWIKKAKQLCKTRKTLIVECKATGEFAGRAALWPYLAQITALEIQAVVAQKYWGQHFGSEIVELLMHTASDTIKASSVIVICDPEHKNALALADELGFIYHMTREDGHVIYRHEFERAIAAE